jgi:hypothetical protein
MRESSVENHPTADDRKSPTFVPRKGVLLREYHVVVKWADGRRMKVGRFLRKPDAARWIEQKSADWLAENSTAEASN